MMITNGMQGIFQSLWKILGFIHKESTCLLLIIVRTQGQDFTNFNLLWFELKMHQIDIRLNLSKTTMENHLKLMFLLGSALLLHFEKNRRSRPKMQQKEVFMRLLNPFTIPKKENCNLCRIQKNKKEVFKNHLLDNLFRKLYRQRFYFVCDRPATVSRCFWFKDQNKRKYFPSLNHY